MTPVVVTRVFAGYSKISCSCCEWPNIGSSFFQKGAGCVLRRWSEVPSRGEVAVVHCKKNYLLYEDANLWPCDFTNVTAFSSLFFLALHYCFFLYIFGLLWLFLWLNFFFNAKFFFMVVVFFFKGTFLPWLLLFLAVSLASSAQFFLVFFFSTVGLPSLLIGSSYGILLGLLLPSFLFIIIVVFVLIDTWLGSFFFWSLLFFRLYFSLTPCFSFKWFCSF